MSFYAKQVRMIRKKVMKKLSMILCVLLVAVGLSACSTFHSDTTQNYPQTNPYATTIFLRVIAIPDGSTIDAELTRWTGAVLINQPTDEDATKIVSKPVITPAANGVYRVDLTLQNVPDTVLTKTTRPFKIIYHRTVYNPIALLPADDPVFEYYILFGSKRRHSSASTTTPPQYQDNEYTYFWTDATPIEFTDIYPNRPLYFILIGAGALIIGVIVYLISRYYDCKKRKYQL